MSKYKKEIVKFVIVVAGIWLAANVLYKNGAPNPKGNGGTGQTSGADSSEPVKGVSNANQDLLSDYAVILGRASGCDIDIEIGLNSIDAWLERTYSGEQRTMMANALKQGMDHHAKLQTDGENPESCTEIGHQLQTFPWP